MKAKIHPDYHKITVLMTDGTKYETRSCWGKEGDVLQLDVDPKTHPAWVGGVNLRKTGQMEKFNNKFAFLDKGASIAPKKEGVAAPVAAQAQEAKPAAKKEAKAEVKSEKKEKAEKKEKKEEPKA